MSWYPKSGFPLFQKPSFPDLLKHRHQSKTNSEESKTKVTKDDTRTDAEEEENSSLSSSKPNEAQIEDKRDHYSLDGTCDEGPSCLLGLYQIVTAGVLQRDHLSAHCTIIAAILLATRWLGCGSFTMFCAWFICEGCEALASANALLLWHTFGISTSATDPSFVLDKDGLRTVGWFNNFLRHFWATSLRPWAATDGRTYLNHRLAERLQDFNGLWLFLKWFLNPRVLELDLGNQIPWITGIKTSNGDQTNQALIVDLGIYCHLKPRIRLSLNSLLNFGIDRVVLSCPVRLTLDPIMDHGKLGCVRLSILRTPLLDYETTGLAGWLSWAIPKRVVRVLLEQFLSFAITPRCFVLRIQNPTKEEEAAELPVPEGLVRVKYVKKRRVDSTVNPFLAVWLMKSRPYFLLSLAPLSADSASGIDSSPNVFEFPVTKKDIDQEALTVEAAKADGESVCSDGAGRVTRISLLDVQQKGTYDKWCKLGGRGKILLRFYFINVIPATETPNWPGLVSSNPNINQAVLALKLHGLNSNLPLGSMPVNHPFVSISPSGGPESLSSEGIATANFEFNDDFLFPIHDVECDKVTFSLLDYHSSHHNSDPIQLTILQRYIYNIPRKLACRGSEELSYYLLGKATLNLEELTGFKQMLRLESGCEEESELIITGTLYFCVK